MGTRMLIRTSLIALAMAASATAAQAGPLCDAARAAAPGRPCAESEHGVALAFTLDRANELLGFAKAGEEAFKARFGVEPSRYVVSETGATGREDRAEALKAAGFGVVVPWRLRQAQINAEIGGMTTRFREMMAANGMSDDQITQAMQQPLARMRERHTPEAMAANEAGTIPRILGTGWYARAFWPDAAPEPEARHGSPGPDWMDEISGQLLETPAMAEDKRTQFADVYGGRHRMAPASDAAKLLDLPAFLSAEHPMRALAAGQNGGQGGGPVRIMMGGQGGGAPQSMPAPMLYGFQARMFADYLIETSGDPAVFGRLGRALGAGTTFDAWLAAEGAGLGLPATPDALAAGWRQWVQGKLGAPAAG